MYRLIQQLKPDSLSLSLSLYLSLSLFFFCSFFSFSIQTRILQSIVRRATDVPRFHPSSGPATNTSTEATPMPS